VKRSSARAQLCSALLHISQADPDNRWPGGQQPSYTIRSCTITSASSSLPRVQPPPQLRSAPSRAAHVGVPVSSSWVAMPTNRRTKEGIAGMSTQNVQKWLPTPTVLATSDCWDELAKCAKVALSAPEAALRDLRPDPRTLPQRCTARGHSPATALTRPVHSTQVHCQ
jgi:hypothetical protein